jgi:hypothetical protein
MGWKPDAATESIFATFAVNLSVATACMIIFEALRNYQLDIYSPKLRRKPWNEMLPQPGKYLLGWILPVWNASDDDILHAAGLDAYVLLRHLRMCYQICWMCSLIGGFALLSVYYTSNNDDDDGVYGVGLFSMANVPDQGKRLWAAVAFAYVFTFIFLYCIDAEYANFAQVRAKYVKGGEDDLPPQMHYSVIVENIPMHYRTSSKLKELLETFFPNQVQHAYVAISLSQLESLVKERDNMLAQLEDAIAYYESSGREKRRLIYLNNGIPIPKPGKGMEVQIVDAIDYLSDQISIRSAEIAELQLEAKLTETGANVGELQRAASMMAAAERGSMVSRDSAPSRLSGSPELSTASSISYARFTEDSIAVELLPAATTPSGKRALLPGEIDQKLLNALSSIKGTITSHLISATGFVTFRSKCVQAVAVGLPGLSAEFPELQVNAAPAPSDIIWSNLSASTEHTEAMAYLTSYLYYTGLAFWTVVLAFIATISNLSYLSESGYFSFLRTLDDTSYAILQGLLPVIIMITFLTIIPYVMELICLYIERRKTISIIQEEVFQW